MKSMDKISTGIAYGTSAGSAGYWFLQLLDKVTPSQWAAIGVLGIRTGGRVLAVNSQTRTLTLDREITLPSSGTTLISLVDGQGVRSAWRFSPSPTA